MHAASRVVTRRACLTAWRATQVVGRHILGAREFARYYRQRPRPEDSRALTQAAGAGGTRHAHAAAAASCRGVTASHRPDAPSLIRVCREQGLVLGKNGNMPSYRGAAVSKQARPAA
jgi:hypothetical protein